MELLQPIYWTASSSAEPGCITYRINRSVNGSQVLVYEEYIHEEAYRVSAPVRSIVHGFERRIKRHKLLKLSCFMQAHLATTEYQAFMQAKDAEGLLSYLELDVMEEVKL